MRSLRSLFGEPLDRTNRKTPPAVEVARAVAARIEAEVPRVEVDVRVRNGRPEVAERTGIAVRSTEAAAGAGKKYTSGGIRAPASDNIPVDAVHFRPSPIALTVEVI